MTLMAAETSSSKGTCQWILAPTRPGRDVGRENGEGCFARYINLILWILDRWWEEKDGWLGGGWRLASSSLNIHRKEGIEIGCNRI